MTLYIIRHGETALNRQNIVQGSGVDSDLNNTGHRQAALFFNYYQNIRFDLVITSALKRTHQTVAPFLIKSTNFSSLSRNSAADSPPSILESYTPDCQSSMSFLK